ncbi:MAG: polyphosphate kinase 2 [Chitinophagales bacterium]|nr:polyphosphate kinase 2 [Chitinophagales bacterium]
MSTNTHTIPENQQPSPEKKTKESTKVSLPLKAKVEEATSANSILNAYSQVSISMDELQNLRSKKDLENFLQGNSADPKKLLDAIKYETELEKLQIELVKLQRWVQEKGKRVAIIFEGRDAAGKGGTIRRFTEHINPRAMRVVALPKPTEEERGQWYFQRYTRQLPNKGEIVFFDRSWYNRAVVEPVNGFCSEAQYDIFMQQVPEFEHMLYEDGITIIKFWFSISKEEQLRRFNSRKANPLKQWKLSPVDMEAQEKWDIYTRYKEVMFSKTHTSFSPWIIVKANNKQKARLESIRYVLSIIPYIGKEDAKVSLQPNTNIITRYHRHASRVD